MNDPYLNVSARKQATQALYGLIKIFETDLEIGIASAVTGFLKIHSNKNSEY